MVSWWMQYLAKGPRLDFNNCPWANLNSGRILAQRCLFESDWNNGSPPSHSNIGQVEDTPVQVLHLWFPGECNIWPKAPGLASIMAQVITQIVAAFCPRRLFESNSNNGAQDIPILECWRLPQLVLSPPFWLHYFSRQNAQRRALSELKVLPKVVLIF